MHHDGREKKSYSVVFLILGVREEREMGGLFAPDSDIYFSFSHDDHGRWREGKQVDVYQVDCM